MNEKIEKLERKIERLMKRIEDLEQGTTEIATVVSKMNRS
jgi:prefoldin subunit 5